MTSVWPEHVGCGDRHHFLSWPLEHLGWVSSKLVIDFAVISLRVFSKPCWAAGNKRVGGEDDHWAKSGVFCGLQEECDLWLLAGLPNRRSTLCFILPGLFTVPKMHLSHSWPALHPDFPYGALNLKCLLPRPGPVCDSCVPFPCPSGPRTPSRTACLAGLQTALCCCFCLSDQKDVLSLYSSVREGPRWTGSELSKETRIPGPHLVSSASLMGLCHVVQNFQGWCKRVPSPRGVGTSRTWGRESKACSWARTLNLEAEVHSHFREDQG